MFRGTVNAVNYLPNTECCHVYSGTVTFDVVRWWKGTGDKQIQVGAYGYLFDIGKEYVVFAMGSPPEANACNRVKQTRESADTLRWLNQRPSRVPKVRVGTSSARTDAAPATLCARTRRARRSRQ